MISYYVLEDQRNWTVREKLHPNSMNSFFCSVGKNLADKVDPVPNPHLTGDFEINNHKAKMFKDWQHLYL